MKNPAIYHFKRSAGIEQAVILAAGFGSRLARSDRDIKPLCQVGGKSLIRRNIELLVDAGIKSVVIVTGYRAKQLREQLVQECSDIDVELVFAYNAEYQKQNGLSVLAAKNYVRGRFLLMMADHIFAPEMIEQASQIIPPSNGAVLCVDYKLDAIFDMDDATKAMVDESGRITSISKQLQHYNAVDTGLFICSQALFEALEVARSESERDDCSLSQGVSALIRSGTMLAHDIGSCIWQDVDDEMMLAQAKRICQSAMPSYRRHVSRSTQRVNPQLIIAASLSLNH